MEVKKALFGTSVVIIDAILFPTYLFKITAQCGSLYVKRSLTVQRHLFLSFATTDMEIKEMFKHMEIKEMLLFCLNSLIDA